MVKCVLIVLAILIINDVTESKYIEGQLNSKEDWVFLTRFCFLSHVGRLRFNFEFQLNMEPIYMLLYDDEDWPLVYNTNLTSCADKVAPLVTMNSYRIIPLSPQEFFSGCESTVQEGANIVINCSAERSFESVRERWWFVVLSRCGGRWENEGDQTSGLQVAYKILMTNDDHNIFYRQFSADEFYILPVDIAFFVADVLLMFISFGFAVRLYHQRLLHITYKLFVVSLCLEVIHMFVEVVAYGRYARNGLSYYGSITCGNVFGSASLIVFVLMLLLLSKGLTVTRSHISRRGTILLFAFFILYAVNFTALFIWQTVGFDPGLVLYIYQSPAGYCLVAIRLIAWAWFTRCTIITIRDYKGQRMFYIPFLLFFTFWFWMSPMFILISNLRLDPWVRNTVTNSVDCAVTFAGYLFFLILTRPTAVNNNFPFAIHTIQMNSQNSMLITDAFDYPSSHYAANEQHVSFAGGRMNQQPSRGTIVKSSASSQPAAMTDEAQWKTHHVTDTAPLLDED